MSDERVSCAICGQRCRIVDWHHLKTHGMTVAEYKAAGHPTHSPAVLAAMKHRMIGNSINPHVGEYGAAHHRWKGGSIAKNGYRMVRIKGKLLYEHRLVAEKMLGRPLLRSEHVHHINHDRLDNHPENLMVTGVANHHRIHGSVIRNQRWAEARATAIRLREQGMLIREIVPHVHAAYETVRRWVAGVTSPAHQS